MPEPVKLRPTEDRQVIATAVSIVVGVTDDRQMTFQTGFQGDETPEEINRRFDGMMALADRQQAKYKLIKARKDLVKLQETYDRFLEDKADVEARHIKGQAERDVQVKHLRDIREDELKKFVADMDVEVLKLNELRKERFNAGLEQARSRGRMGSYVPAGADAAALKNIDSAISKVKEARDTEIERWNKGYDANIEAIEKEINRVNEDRAQHAGNLDIQISRFEKEIAAAKEEIDEFQAVVEG